MIYGHPSAYICYQCDKPCSYLFPDSRCKDCTRALASEIIGALPEVEEIDARVTVVFDSSELQLKATHPGVVGVRRVKPGLWTGTVFGS